MPRRVTSVPFSSWPAMPQGRPVFTRGFTSGLPLSRRLVARTEMPDGDMTAGTEISGFIDT